MSSKAPRCLRQRSQFYSTVISTTTLVPFLYQTSTICQRHFHFSRSSRQDGSDRWIPANIREAKEANEARKARRLEAIPGNPTITPAERRVFQRMFDYVGKAGRPKQQPPQKKEAPTEPTEDPEFALLERESWRNIFSDSSDAAIAEEVEEVMSGDMEERAPLIESYPRPLQSMAHRAHYQLSQQKRREEFDKRLEKERTEQRKVEASDKVLRGRRDKMRQIGVEMLRAETDVEVWKILDEKLFSPMRRLHTEVERLQAEKQNKKKSKKARRKEKKSLQDKETGETAAAEEKAAERPLPMTNKEMSMMAYMYHPLLLLATRLLCRRTKYTPIATALLPAVKSLGYSSYVLGASTGLYNCLIEYYWRVLGDVGTILSLLQEMDSAGLSMDENTDQVLAKIVAHSQEAENGLLGRPLQVVEQMEGRANEIEHIRQWRQAIQHSIEERRVEEQLNREFDQRMEAEDAEEALDNGIDQATGSAAFNQSATTKHEIELEQQRVAGTA